MNNQDLYFKSEASKYMFALTESRLIIEASKLPLKLEYLYQ